MVTISDVAARAGVSRATVSRVLNDLPSVNTDMVERVRRAIADTGYVPNGVGRALRLQRADTWAAIVPDVQNPFFLSVVAAIENIAVTRGYTLVLCNTDERLDREQSYINTALVHRMSGVVIAVASTDKSDISPLLTNRVPTVTIDRTTSHHQTDSVTMDNIEAGYLAGRHLIRLGYRRIACITGPPDVSATEDRLRGFRRALQEAGFPLSENLVRRTDLRSESAEIALRSLLVSSKQPDAAFATNGPSTMGAYKAIKALSLNMPDDIALAGVDDDVWTRMVSPAVTVIQQPVTEIGQLAGQLLINRLTNDSEDLHNIVLPPTLLPRGSTVPA